MDEDPHVLTICEMWTEKQKLLIWQTLWKIIFYNAGSCSSYQQYIRNSV